MIDVKNLKKNYGEKQALQGIDFEVNSGEIFGFLGPNGAGKTTTLKILTGQLTPTEGTAWIMGKDVLHDRDVLRPELGFVPEKTNLYERLTIGQNLEFYARLYGADLQRVNYFLEQVGLLKEKKTLVKKLSKGMKQRVLLVRSLLHNPKVLFLDEPTSGLDPASANDIYKLLTQMNEENKMTIMLTSHNMEEVEKLCHRVAFLNSGSIVATGSPEELKLQYTNRKMRVLIEVAHQREEHILDLEGSASAEKLAEWVKKGQVLSIHSLEPSMAEIFLKVTGRELA